jgi:hypothetical protein
MKNLTLIILGLLFVSLTACTSMNNPLSSEVEEEQGSNNHTPLYSGHSQNG